VPDLRAEILASVVAAAQALGVGDEVLGSIHLSEPADSGHGDLTLPCFPFAKELRRGAQQIAAELKLQLDATDLVALAIARVEVAGPYLNIFLEPTALIEKTVRNVLAAGEAYGSARSGAGKRALVEHTSINPNASPHLGRARNAWIGDTVCRLLRFEGYAVDTHFFVNDVGRQIAILVAGIGAGTPSFRELLEVYIEANARFEADEAFRSEVEGLLRALQAEDRDVHAAFRRIVDISVRGMTEIFADADVHFQHFDYESDYLTGDRYAQLIAAFRQKGKLFEDEHGRLVLDLAGYELPSRNPVMPVSRGDKTSLYPLRDIAYTLDKIASGADLNLIVLGEDQKLYHRQVTAALDILDAPAPTAVHYSYVSLEGGSMSSRQGNVVLLEDFVREAKQKAGQELEARGQVADPRVSSAVAYSALKYAFLRVANEKQVTFQWDAAMAFEGETGPYLLYSYARISSILRKYAGPPPVADGADYTTLGAHEELELAKELDRCPDVIHRALQERSPHILAGYTYAVAKQFSTFYHACPILQSEPPRREARLLLAMATRQVLDNMLGLIGITPLQSM
jgi:arginyl-tRNA synthetase